VRSNASPELAKIRGNLGKKRTAADRIFYRSLKRYSELGVLGDFRESVHENKRVLAINAAYKGRVNGIFHGSSAKSSLYFVEPAEMIEINNEIALLEEEEKREIKRILVSLTAYVAQFRTPIQERAQLMVRLDFLHAKGRFAFDQQCHMPQLLPYPHLELEQAFNPVLRHYNKLKGRDVVPLSMQLNKEQRMLVISGPNAGGKSLTLKTAGLLAVMLQSGLLIPAHPRSKMGIFQNLFGDIGDSQSIENELSTYSSKLEKMKIFLQWADADTLLLIDEFGSGSDPDLGGAIAQVFLQKLNSYSAFGVLTTHYNGIKALAAQLSGVENGSMRFNKHTFEPEYVLQMGLPGSSYTFEVALRSGIPEPLIAAAQQRMEKRTLQLDNLLVAIQDEKNTLHAERTQLKTRMEEMEQLAKDHERHIKKLEEKVAKQTDLNETHSDQLKWGKRFGALIASYLKDPTPKTRKEVTTRFLRMLTEGAAEQTKAAATQTKKVNKKREAQLERLLSEPIKVGDAVKLLHSKQPGTVVEIRGDKYVVSFGIMKSSVTRDKIILADRKF
jgi:DNA mismatch repair protein MutS2